MHPDLRDRRCASCRLLSIRSRATESAFTPLRARPPRPRPRPLPFGISRSRGRDSVGGSDWPSKPKWLAALSPGPAGAQLPRPAASRGVLGLEEVVRRPAVPVDWVTKAGGVLVDQ